MNVMTTPLKRHPDARFWDRIARRYAAKPVPDQAVYAQKLAKTAGYLKPTDRVLEIGCGTGTTALHHAGRVARVLAADISPRMIEIARGKAVESGAANVEFLVAGPRDLQLAAGSQDVVMAHSILHLLPDVEAVIQQVHQWLKPGGVFVSSTPCLGDSVPWFKVVGPLGHFLGLLPRLTVFTASQLLDWLQGAGFELEERWLPGPRSGLYLIMRKP